MEYTSKGQGALNTVLGAVGTYGALGGGLGGLFGGKNTEYVTKEAFDLQVALINSQKDNAILSADLSSEKKMVEVFQSLNDKIMNVREETNTKLNALETTVNANAASQAVINCGFSSANAVLQSQVAQLMGMTKIVIPNANICPGWDTTTTTTTA